MRKSSKILAVVIAVALLCAAIATMVSATAGEIIYPEYTAPAEATKIWNLDFNSGEFNASGKYTAGGVDFSAQNGMVGSLVDNGSGNQYVNITNWVDGEMVGHTGGSNTYGNANNAYKTVKGGSYFVWSFDVMADKYATQYDFDGETINELITIEDYNALDEEDKALYWPSYTETYYMIEMPQVNGLPRLFILKDSANKFYVADHSGSLTSGSKFQLPSEAGVWTNIQMIVKTDVNVRYTVGGETTTVTYGEYQALDKKTGHENVTVIYSADTALYANGQYMFDCAAWDVAPTEIAYDKYAPQYKYAQMKAGLDSSARVKAPMSMCYDNIGGWLYAADYEGDFGTAFDNRASLLDAEDAIFNQNYNLTDSLAATVTTADGTYGYGSVEQAFNAAVDGATIEIFAANYATLNVSTDVKNLTVKTNGKAFNYTLPEGYPYACEETSAGVYEIYLAKYAAPEYIGPDNSKVTYLGNKEFTNSQDVGASGGYITSNHVTANGNGYAQLYWNKYEGTAQKGEYTPGNLGMNGGYANGILDYDIYTIEFDIMAEQYRNISTRELISIEEYEKLSDTDKAAYEPSYHGGYFYIEIDKMATSYSYEKMPRVAKMGGVWSIFNGTGIAPLSTQAGVWNHVSFVYKMGNTVTYYTDDTKTTTATMSYNEYVKSGKGADYFVKVNSGDTVLSIYVDGEFCFDLGGWQKDITNYTDATKVNAKYMRIRGASSSTSTFSNNFAMGFDNYKTFGYKEGYTGDYATAIANKASFAACDDAPFNKDYNKLPPIAGITAEGAEYGYYVYNQSATTAALFDKCTLELFGDFPMINVAGTRELTVISNGYDFDFKGNPGDPYDMTELEDGVYLIKMRAYKGPTYVGPTSTTNLGNTDFETANTMAGATGFSAQNGFVANVTTDANTNNTYAQVTNMVGVEMATNTGKQYGGLHANYFEVAYGDYFTFSFDIMADKYTDGTNIITPEQYKALDAEQKANYSLSYTATRYYAEAPYLVANYKTLILREFNGRWYICTDAANANNLDTQAGLLSNEAGVWNNVTMAFKTDVNVRYTENSVTQTVSYAAYMAAGQPEKDSAVVVISSDYAVYINGEYAFDYAGAEYVGKEMAFATFQTGNNRTFRYMQMQAGIDATSSTRVTNPTSICYDNIRCDRYPDGYNGSFATAFENRTALHAADSVFNGTYNKTGTLTAAVIPANGDLGVGYYAQESAYALVENGDTIELFNSTDAVLVPAVDLIYIKTNGNTFNTNLPDGYTCYETETKGTYVVKVAGPEDMVDVDWIIDGEVYATTKEYIGAAADLEYALTKVHPWVSQYVESWADAEGNSVVKAGKNTFTAVLGYKATPAIMTNVTTTQAIVTNGYVPALTEEEAALVSGIGYYISNAPTNNAWGRKTDVTVNGVAYYKVEETMRIIYNNQAAARTATLKFTYNEVELSVTFECDAGAYFERVLNGNFTTLEKEFIYTALVYCDTVARGARCNDYVSLVSQYAQYAPTNASTLEEIIASAKKENLTSSAVLSYGLSVSDGYAARIKLVVDPAVVGADFTKASIMLHYKTVRGEKATIGFDSYNAETGELTSSYGTKIYNLRQTFDVVIGEEVVGSFNLAAYIADLVKAGYAETSMEMQIALAMYHYSECSEAYKRS